MDFNLIYVLCEAKQGSLSVLSDAYSHVIQAHGLLRFPLNSARPFCPRCLSRIESYLSYTYFTMSTKTTVVRDGATGGKSGGAPNQT